MTVSSADRGQVEDLLRTIAATDTTTAKKQQKLLTCGRWSTTADVMSSIKKRTRAV